MAQFDDKKHRVTVVQLTDDQLRQITKDLGIRNQSRVPANLVISGTDAATAATSAVAAITLVA